MGSVIFGVRTTSVLGKLRGLPLPSMAAVLNYYIKDKINYLVIYANPGFINSLYCSIFTVFLFAFQRYYTLRHVLVLSFEFCFNLAYNTVMDCLHLFFFFLSFLSLNHIQQKMCVFVCRYKISFKYSIALLTVQIIKGIIHNYVLINDKLKDTLITMLNIQ